MFKDETCLDKFAIMLVGASVACAASLGAPPPPGMIEAMTAGTGVLARLSGQRRAEAERVLKALQRDLKSQWRNWSEEFSRGDASSREGAVASFEEVIPHCMALPCDVVGKRLDANSIAHEVLHRAEKVLPVVYGDTSPRNAEAYLARKFLLDVTRNAYARLIAEPGYMEHLAPALWQDVLTWQTRMEDKQDAQTAMLEELLARSAPGLPLATAKAILLDFGHGEVPDDPAQIERLLRAKAEEYNTYKDRIRELDGSGDIIVHELLGEADALAKNGRFVEADAKLIKAERADEAAHVLRRARFRATRGDLARLRLQYREAAGHYDAAANFVSQLEPQSRWIFEILRAEALYRLGDELGDRAALLDCIQLFERDVLPHLPRVKYPRDWAGAHYNLGNALRVLSGRDGNKTNLEKAASAYREALNEWTRERVPQDWAKAQNGLGIVLAILGEIEGSRERLNKAVAALRLALTEQTRERNGLAWSQTQTNLGNTLTLLGQYGAGKARFEQAVYAYKLALEELTPERAPLEWANAQNGLGIALMLLGQLDRDPVHLEAAIDAFRRALEVRKPETVPIEWASSQNNLGGALTFLGAYGGGDSRLVEAIEAFDLALQEYTIERGPIDHADAVGNQGTARLFLAQSRQDFTLARLALRQMEEACSLLRASGHLPRAATFERQIPVAEALVERLS
ncbi:hypothetical protein [Amaricoccus macauensis]|uniref:hypothetical protein n=1 Tax=Amaricoccus macauensis TaxID=57001 RepID=UPI003C7CA8E9